MMPVNGAAAELQPLISISIVSHGDWQPLVALLESITAHERISGIQLIVTENLGSDLPELAPSGWHSVVMLSSPRPRGFAENHNAAFEHARGEFFCILNPDVLFPQSVFEHLLARLEGGLGQMAAPILVDSRGAIQDSFRGLPTPSEIVRRWLGITAPRPSLESDSLLFPDWIAGMFMLMRSSTFSRLGGFDGRYRLYFEDVDLCTRLRLLGMRVVVDPSLRLLHDPRRRSRRPGRHLLWHLHSAARFYLSDTYRRGRRLSQHA
jgi:N-acetylglucosaminyl-diphospho-decaprenol L-rhamnosyltransferase